MLSGVDACCQTSGEDRNRDLSKSSKMSKTEPGPGPAVVVQFPQFSIPQTANLSFSMKWIKPGKLSSSLQFPLLVFPALFQFTDVLHLFPSSFLLPVQLSRHLFQKQVLDTMVPMEGFPDLLNFMFTKQFSHVNEMFPDQCVKITHLGSV